MNCKLTRTSVRREGSRGMTLAELMVSVAIGSMLLAMASSLWLFGSRSFAAMGNYADLNTKSRHALDQMSRDVRQATRVTGFQKSGSTKWLSVTNAATGEGITYRWDARSRNLVCQKTGEPDQVYLTECDRWDFDLYQRVPLKDATYVFWPATNKVGAYDLSICKLINMTWKCSRTILGSKLNSESVQTAQVVLRNKR